MDIDIHWANKVEMEEIFRINTEGFEHPWTMEELAQAKLNRHTFIFVATAQPKDTVVGYIVYSQTDKKFDILTLGVEPTLWRNQIGTKLVNKIKKKCTVEKRRLIVVQPSEHNTRAHLFFKANGFRATGVSKNYYGNEEYTEDAYRMIWEKE